jgi:hypothetical protein
MQANVITKVRVKGRDDLCKKERAREKEEKGRKVEGERENTRERER